MLEKEEEKENTKIIAVFDVTAIVAGQTFQYRLDRLLLMVVGR